MRIVLDTNVLVSGLLRAYGHSAHVLRLVLERQVQLALDERILQEYEDVLARPKFGFDRDRVASILRELRQISLFSGLSTQAVALPDPKDHMFLEVALAVDADGLVTGNGRHFPAEACFGMRVIAPADFMRAWAEHTQA